MKLFRQIFGLITRVVGLVLVLYAALCAIWAGLQTIGIEAEEQPGEAFLFSIWAVISGLIGFYFLRGAPGLIDWAYPERRDEDGTD